MGNVLFYDELKSSLATSQTLEDVEKNITKEIDEVSDYTIGFVVGKVTAVGNETRESNLAILEKRTREIAEIELGKGILVFSSSVIPPFIETSVKINDFYIFWENIVEKCADILYTTPEFELSKGASSEIALGRKMGKKIVSYEDAIASKTSCFSSYFMLQ